MFSRIGAPEVIVVFVVLLILFGGKKLPELAKGLGEALQIFRKSVKEPEEKNKEK